MLAPMPDPREYRLLEEKLGKERYAALTQATIDWLVKRHSSRHRMEEVGCAAIPLVIHDPTDLTNAAKVDAFLQQLDECTGAWFEERLHNVLHPTNELEVEFAAELIDMQRVENGLVYGPMRVKQGPPGLAQVRGPMVSIHRIITPKVKKGEAPLDAECFAGAAAAAAAPAADENEDEDEDGGEDEGEDEERAPPGKMEQKKRELEFGRMVYCKLATEHGEGFEDLFLRGLCDRFSPRHPAARTLLFQSKHWDAHVLAFVDEQLQRVPLDDSPLRPRMRQGLAVYVKDIVAYVKFGDAAMAQGGMTSAWLSNGFGLWAHLPTEIGLLANEYVRRVLWHDFNMDTILAGPAHMIYKAESGGSLATHHDQIPTQKLITDLRTHLGIPVDAGRGEVAPDGTDTSTTKWIARHGFQCLAHLDGGKSVPGQHPDQGQTYIIGPMNCQRLLWCMEWLVWFGTTDHPPKSKLAKAKSKAFPKKGMDKFLTGNEGPYFCTWQMVLPELNAHLRALYEKHDMLEQHRDIGILAIQPDQAPAHIQQLNGFAALWPTGFPHGSLSNTSTRRVTVGINLKFRKPGDAVRPAVQSWYRNVAKVADPLTPTTEWQDAENAIFLIFDQELKAWADGKTHENPERAIKWITAGRPNRDGEEAWWKQWRLLKQRGYKLTPRQRDFYKKAHAPRSGVAGHFQRLAPTVLVVDRFLQSMNTQWMPAAATAPAATAPDEEDQDGSEGDSPGPAQQQQAKAQKTQPAAPQAAAPPAADPSVVEYPPEQSPARPNLVRHVRPPKPKPTQWSHFAGKSTITWAELWDHPDLRMLNVKQPWASVIVFGCKNVENRGFAFTTKTAPNCWVLIVASASSPTAEAYTDMQERATDSVGYIADATRKHELALKHCRDEPTRQAIVGVARIVGSWQKGDASDAFAPYAQSPWFNGHRHDTADFAWCIRDALYFDTPILGVKGSQTPLNLLNSPKNADSERIKAELRTRTLLRAPADASAVDAPTWDL